MNNFAPKGKEEKTIKTSQRRCNLSVVPNTMRKVFQLAKRVKEIPAGKECVQRP